MGSRHSARWDKDSKHRTSGVYGIQDTVNGDRRNDRGQNSGTNAILHPSVVDNKPSEVQGSVNGTVPQVCINGILAAEYSGGVTGTQVDRGSSLSLTPASVAKTPQASSSLHLNLSFGSNTSIDSPRKSNIKTSPRARRNRSIKDLLKVSPSRGKDKRNNMVAKKPLLGTASLQLKQKTGLGLPKKYTVQPFGEIQTLLKDCEVRVFIRLFALLNYFVRI